jgi:tRNA dimethylallyltransferase
MNSPLPSLAVIAGPTASGKSGLAIELALRERGVVINADASQVYADLRIVSARPAEAEMKGVAHRLFGFRDGSQPLSAAEWAELARAEIARAHAEGQLPILVGGTGLYLRTLLFGIAPVPDIDPEIREAVRSLETEALRGALVREDPAMAARLGPRDRQRMARALEVVRSTGRSLVEFHAETTGGIADRVALRPMVVEVERQALYRRCEERFQTMLMEGAVAEVAALAARGLDPSLPVMKAIGVRPLLAHVAGERTLEEAAAEAVLDTRRYAKRQVTWFSNQTPGWPRIRR